LNTTIRQTAAKAFGPESDAQTGRGSTGTFRPGRLAPVLSAMRHPAGLTVKNGGEFPKLGGIDGHAALIYTV